MTVTFALAALPPLGGLLYYAASAEARENGGVGMLVLLLVLCGSIAYLAARSPRVG